MKKLLVLFILLASVFKYDFVIGADVKSIAIGSNYDGSSVDITIKDSKEILTERFSLNPAGRIEMLDIYYLENGNSIALHIYFRDGKADSMQYIYRKADVDETRFVSYARNDKNNENLFALIDKIAGESAKKYDFAVLAAQENKRKRVQYQKEQEEKKKQEDAERKRVPSPEPMLKKIQNM